MSDDIDLDLTWLDDTKKLLTANKNYDKEPLQYITLHFCYINHTTSEIQKIITEKHYFSDISNTSLSPSAFISSKSLLNGLQYNCKSVSSFFVDLEPEHIQIFAKTNTYYNFFNKSLDMSNNIVCPPTIFIFHSLNSLFFLFQEMPPLDLVPRGILTHLNKPRGGTKKRVSFNNKTYKVNRGVCL